MSAATAPLDGADRPVVSVVLPCLNEVASVGRCVTEAAVTAGRAGLGAEVVVVDNGSTDGSAAEAAGHGARVVREPRPGYGRARGSRRREVRSW